MLVYHTAYGEIRKPDVGYGRKNADFGQGFYLTADAAFAARWGRARRGERVMINTYDLDLAGLRVRRFSREEGWLAYILDNRAGRTDALAADVVIGPIANDTLFETFGLLTSGFLPRQTALELLRLGPAYEQIALKTKEAAQRLCWRSVRVIPEEELQATQNSLAAEEAAYQEALATVMERLL